MVTPDGAIIDVHPTAAPACVEVGGERIEVRDWRGMIGHNWGAEHAERWVWIQGSGFEKRGGYQPPKAPVSKLPVVPKGPAPGAPKPTPAQGKKSA